MKLHCPSIHLSAYRVAPFAGAWIETKTDCIKHLILFVAPFAGAWIETGKFGEGYILYLVAPFAGAWIETVPISTTAEAQTSLPSRERGLKPNHEPSVGFAHYVAPFAGAWIET